MSAPKPLPYTEDTETGGFWRAAAEGRLVVRSCMGCGAVLHLPKSYCHRCGSWNTQWREVDGTATVYSWTVVRHQVHSAFDVPYTVVLVELDDAPGARLIGHLPGAVELAVGTPMLVRFEEPEPGVALPNWDPA